MGIKQITLEELKRTPLTEEQIQITREAIKKAQKDHPEEDPDCPKLTKEELAGFRPWYEVHPDFYK